MYMRSLDNHLILPEFNRLFCENFGGHVHPRYVYLCHSPSQMPQFLYEIYSDGSDEIIYDVSVHTSSDGVPCRNQIKLNNICLLPIEQSHKESEICRSGKSFYTS